MPNARITMPALDKTPRTRPVEQRDQADAQQHARARETAATTPCPIGQRQPINPSARHNVAAAAANENEFHIADLSRRRSRRAVPSRCAWSRPVAPAASPRTATRARLCRRRKTGTSPRPVAGGTVSRDTGPSSARPGDFAGAGTRPATAAASPPSASSSASAPRVSKVVLNRTQTSAGKTFTCKIAGTAKLFSASTNVSTAACASAPRASGSSNPRTSARPVTAGSLSSWDGSSRRHAPSTSSSVIGQVSSARIQTVPPSE